MRENDKVAARWQRHGPGSGKLGAAEDLALDAQRAQHLCQDVGAFHFDDKRHIGAPPTTSAAEQVATWAQGVRVVKAFNTTGFGNMHDPRYGSQAATMFLCGD